MARSGKSAEQIYREMSERAKRPEVLANLAKGRDWTPERRAAARERAKAIWTPEKCEQARVRQAAYQERVRKALQSLA